MAVSSIQDGAPLRRVLLLDDEKLVRFTISAYLKGAGYAVTAAATPEEAIGHLKRSVFDAIVSDVVMGEVDGFMFRDMVRARDASVPFVFLTSMVNDMSNAFLTKVTDDVRSYYVAKGAPRDVLVKRLGQVITASRNERSAELAARDLEKGLRMATFVQRSLMSPWADCNRHYRYCCAWRPFQQVSGDLFEWIRLSETSVLAIFGDVSGHGLQAALAMTAMQSFIKQFGGYADRQARRLNLVARRIHEFICNNLHEVAYMSGTLVYIDFKANRLRYLNAGNPELVCWTDAGRRRMEINPAGKGSMPFGLVKGSAYPDEDIVDFEFPDDAVFLLASDGAMDISSTPDGENMLPTDIFDEIGALAVRDGAKAASIWQIPYRIFRSIEDLGYACHHDDASIIVFSKSVMTPGRLTHKLQLTPDEIDRNVQTMAAFVTDSTGDADLALRLELLLGEFLMNIYEHGLDDYGRRHECGIVSVLVREDRLEVTVMDRGRPWDDFPRASGENERALDARNAAFADGGRGVAILGAVSDMISRERLFNVNRSVFSIPFKRKETT